MKRILLWVGIFIVLTATLMFSEMFGSKATAQEAQASIYDFKLKSLEGKEIDLNQFRGKYMLIVNTASKCGYTPQYADLEKLHEKFGGKVAVLGFPANNFLWQEPGSNEEIATFCERNYGVKFQMFEKISVKGKDKAPLYKWLEAKSGETPSWNFCKYLVSPEGNVLGFFPAKVNPMEKQILDKIVQ
ncbi:MAG TPA: redoxin domain-containing protein [Cyclobacteriaceae bacterium]|nr:redoxin domain-containing protein [Cyclobacteriaceae bacterium]